MEGDFRGVQNAEEHGVQRPENERRLEDRSGKSDVSELGEATGAGCITFGNTSL